MSDLLSIRQVAADRAALLSALPGQQLPEATEALLAQVRQIATGVVFFYGKQAVQVGLMGVDWTGGHIRHQEWPCQLNRFFHLSPLAAAYRHTKDETFAQAARSHILDWIDAARTGRCAMGVWQATGNFPGGTLDMSIRMGTSQHAGWGGTLWAFLDSPAFDDALLEAMLASLADQGEYLAGHLAATGNWRISHLDALVMTALRFPMLRNADALLSAGRRGLRNAFATQFGPDGVHCEVTPSYATWMASVLANYALLARLDSRVQTGVTSELVHKAAGYVAHAAAFAINDNQSGPLSAGLGKARQVLRLAGEPAWQTWQPPLDHAYPHAGQVFLRDGWGDDAEALSFDASAWSSGHVHLSRLGVIYRAGGRELVADPGIIDYEMSNPLAAYGKSTPAHSTINVDGLSQGPCPAQLLRAELSPRACLLRGVYAGGYWNGRYEWIFRQGVGEGLWGVHDRLVLWLKGLYVLVIDRSDAPDGHEVRSCWQLGRMDGWQQDGDRLCGRSLNADTNLCLHVVHAPEGSTMEAFHGQASPPRGWLGKVSGPPEAAWQVEHRYPASQWGRSTVTLLKAFGGHAAPACRVTPAAPDSKLPQIELTWDDGCVDWLGWSPTLAAPVETGGPLVSDATLAWCRLDPAGRPAAMYLLDGSYLEYGGKVLHESPARAAQFVTL